MKHARLPLLEPPAGLRWAPLSPDRPVLLPLPPDEPFDPESTFRCGQVFRWRQAGGTWYGPFGAGSLAFRAVPGGVEARALGVAADADVAWRFLGLDRPLREVYRRLEGDAPLARAFAAYPGLRLLRQDPWDCLIGYVCSQWNNVPKIELSTGRLARGWGRVLRWPEGVEVAVLPSPERLAAAEPEELRPCALGYRARYLTASARFLPATDLAALRGAPYEAALAALLAVPGVGRKVADCILLFSLDQPHACPVDVWVRRVLHELYPRALSRYLPDRAARAAGALSAVEHRALVRFAWDRWGRLAGYAQQYLFHARRQGSAAAPPLVI